YTGRENIEDFKCEKCKRNGGHRTAFVRRRPNVLVIYIDRRQDTNLFGKINRRLTFPARLDLCRWISETDKGPGEAQGNGRGKVTCYSLYAMCVHHDLLGSTASGHYVAYVRDKANRWYQIDDEVVRQVQWSEVEGQHAYLLFYMAEVPLGLAEAVPEEAKPKSAEAAENDAGEENVQTHDEAKANEDSVLAPESLDAEKGTLEEPEETTSAKVVPGAEDEYNEEAQEASIAGMIAHMDRTNRPPRPDRSERSDQEVSSGMMLQIDPDAAGAALSAGDDPKDRNSRPNSEGKQAPKSSQKPQRKQ
ncbi:unnamed protein product, partial [Polarella glacialis]